MPHGGDDRERYTLAAGVLREREAFLVTGNKLFPLAVRPFYTMPDAHNPVVVPWWRDR